MTNATKVAKLLHRIAADEIERYEHAKVFPFPFHVDEDFLRKLRNEVIESLGSVPVAQEPEFKSETRFQDISTVRFDSFEHFVAKAGDRKDPESTILSWNKFALDDSGEPVAGEVRVRFVTEKRLQTQDAPPGDFNHAFIEMVISGSNQDWVESTFSRLSPYVESVKLGGMYRPLWIFRNKWFIAVMAHVTSWIGFFVGVNLATRVFRSTARDERADVLKKILAEGDIAKKLNMFASEILSPSTIPWWEPVLVISMGALTFAVLHIACMALLPKLTPASSIAIGLADKRAQGHLNTFRFIVFSLIVSGIIMPLLVELIRVLF